MTRRKISAHPFSREPGWALNLLAQQRGLFYVDQRGIHGLLFRAALMLVKFGLKLCFGQVSVVEVFLAGAERQPANVTVGQAGSHSDEPCNLEVAIRHGKHDCRQRSQTSNPLCPH